MREQPIYKTRIEIDAMREAGCISAKVLRMAGEIIRPGISTLEIDSYIEQIIRMEGGTPSFKGLYGFPGSACISLNNMVVHGIPSKDVILQEGDIVSIDTGATVDGWVGDNAWTFPVGEVSAEKKRLLQVGEQAMWEGIAAAVAGNTLGDIGYAVQSCAQAAGFDVLREYMGHGIGRKMHEDPSVFNWGKPGTRMRLKEGLVIAIEPMITAGSCLVHTIDDGWGVVTNDGSASCHFEKTVAVIDDEAPVIVTQE